MEKIWLSSYSPGVPFEIDLGQIESIPHFFKEMASKYTERSAFISGATGEKLSYKKLDEMSDDVAAYLQEKMNLPIGSRVGLMMPNLLQYPVCLLGVLKAGCIAVNINPQYTGRELKHQLDDSQTEAIIIVELFAHTLDKIISTTRIKHVIVTGLADMVSQPKRFLANFVIRHVKKLIPEYSLPGSVSFLSALKQAANCTLSKPSLTLDDIAFLQYTGGTTGVSKGAMLSHKNILSSMKQGEVWSAPFIDTNEIQLTVTAIPLYHIYALGFSLGFMAWGGANVLVSDPRNTGAFIKVLRAYQFTCIPAVNTLFNSLVNHPDFKLINFSKLRVAFGGGTTIQRPVAEKWQEITKSPLCEGYGLTECSPNVAFNPFDISEYTGTIGLPIPSTDVVIRNALGEDVPLGEIGELCVKGPQVMKGYWNRPEETTSAFTADGYLKTGDIATMDHKGFIKIVDRLKDMVIVSGFNVYPTEIEEVVQMHPGVFEVACVGKPDAKTGEATKIFVVKKDPDLTTDDLIKHCRENLTNYKVPREIVFMETLPKSQVGKILRRELRDLA